MADQRPKEVDDLLKVFAALDDETTIFALLQDLFTVREIRETSQRLAVAALLAKRRSYLAIEQETGASATTIARVSKCLSAGSGGYKAALAVLQADEDTGTTQGDPDAAANTPDGPDAVPSTLTGKD